MMPSSFVSKWWLRCCFSTRCLEIRTSASSSLEILLLRFRQQKQQMEQTLQDMSLLRQNTMPANIPKIPNKPPQRVICSWLKRVLQGKITNGRKRRDRKRNWSSKQLFSFKSFFFFVFPCKKMIESYDVCQDFLSGRCEKWLKLKRMYTEQNTRVQRNEWQFNSSSFVIFIFFANKMYSRQKNNNTKCNIKAKVGYEVE